MLHLPEINATRPMRLAAAVDTLAPVANLDTPDDRERGNNIDAEQFVDHYEANGWKRGKTAMQDWKASVRTWEKNGFSNNGRQSGKPQKGTDEWKRRKQEVESNGSR